MLQQLVLLQKSSNCFSALLNRYEVNDKSPNLEFSFKHNPTPQLQKKERNSFLSLSFFYDQITNDYLRQFI